ncbi:MAG: PspC domain-containing protein [Anaerotignaceae bacterium]
MLKKICLSKNKKIAGVCGGIAENFGWEPTIVRIITVLLVLLLRFPIILIYVILWIIMPEM